MTLNDRTGQILRWASVAPKQNILLINAYCNKIFKKCSHLTHYNQY